MRVWSCTVSMRLVVYLTLCRLFTDARKLKVLKANHNELNELPPSVQNSIIEELHLEHNEIRSLSPELFIQASR